jgi:hypothetical protein
VLSIRDADTQGTSIVLTFLNTSFRRIWLINVENLCKQVDRSFILVKLRDIIDRDLMIVDDMEVVITRGLIFAISLSFSSSSPLRSIESQCNLPQR